MKSLSLLCFLLMVSGAALVAWGNNYAGLIGTTLCLIGLLGVIILGFLKSLRWLCGLPPSKDSSPANPLPRNTKPLTIWLWAA